MIANLQNVQFGYDDKIILEDISVTFEDGERVGLVGINGAGKSTLLKVLTGKLLPDGGSISIKNGLKYGYLEQGSGLSSGKSVIEEMRQVFSDVSECEISIRNLEIEMSEMVHESSDYRKAVREHGKLNDYMVSRDGYNVEVKIKTVLNGMGFLGDYDKIVDCMSGGEKTRLALAKLLLQPLDLLILDEPTNHLDFTTLYWLENYLSSYKGALLVVSHDRYFLDRTVASIWELQYRKLQSFKGNYTKYKLLKKDQVERQKKEYERQQIEIADKLDYVQKNIARASTSKSAKSRLRQIEHMDIVEKPITYIAPPVFTFEFENESVKDVLTVKDLSLSIAGKSLIESGNLEIKRGSRAAIIGANGVGKSTLLKRLLKSFSEADRNIIWGKNVTIGYYDQENLNLNFNNTVIEELWGRFLSLQQHKVRAMLARVGLMAEDIDKKISVLSGGERVKLGFAILTAIKSNTLLLDEPTNHLDLAAREALEEALQSYEGTIIFVSHDRYFLNSISSEIFEIEGCDIQSYEGNFQSYMEQKNKIAQEQNVKILEPPKTKSFRNAKQRSEEVKLRNAVKEIEKQIAALESEHNRLSEEISKPEISSDYKQLMKKCEEQEVLKNQLNELYEKWEEVSNQLSEYVL